MQDSYRQIWASIADAIKPQVSSDTFQRWFAAIDLVRADEQEMTLRVPNTIHQLWIESNYMPLVQSAVMGVLGAPRQMKFVFARERRRVRRPFCPPAARADGPAVETENGAVRVNGTAHGGNGVARRRASPPGGRRRRA